MAKKSQAPARVPPGQLGDVAFVFGRDESGVHILRRRSEESAVETGVLRPLREGKPIDGEVVSLRRRRDLPLIYDVKTELGAPRALAEKTQAQKAEAEDDTAAGDRRPADGPPQVATPAYRRGWDAIWGRTRGDRLN